MYLLILLTTAFWGGTPVAGKLIIQDIPPITAGLLRYGVTALLLFAIFRQQFPNPRALRGRDLWMLFWIGIFGTFLNHVFFFLGVVYAPATHGAIIPPTTSPVWTTLLAVRRGQERLTASQVVGMILCLAGVVLVIHPERLIAGGGRGALLGDLLFLLGGAAWGIYSYLSALAMRRFSAATTLAFGMAIGTVFLAPAALFERPWHRLRVAHLSAWGALAFLILLGTLCAYLWWNLALHRVGAGRTSVFSNLVPVFGVLFSWIILGERLAPIQLVGGLLAVGGVLTCQHPSALLLWLRMSPARVPSAWKRQKHGDLPS